MWLLALEGNDARSSKDILQKGEKEQKEKGQYPVKRTRLSWRFNSEIQRNSKISIVRDRIVIIRTDFSEFGQYRGDSRLGLANSIATFA